MHKSGVTLDCEYCGQSFYRRKSEHERNPSRFCSRTCCGKFREDENESAFWSKAEVKSNGCWEWNRYLNEDGYGYLSFRGARTFANRAAWILTHGEIPSGKFVLHKCDNPPCINPKHLFLGTHQDNMDDMAKKGRRYHKVTQEMRVIIESQIHPTTELAKRFGISERTVRLYLPRTRNRT